MQNCNAEEKRKGSIIEQYFDKENNMGAWGVGIFSNDDSLDRECAGDGSLC